MLIFLKARIIREKLPNTYAKKKAKNRTTRVKSSGEVVRRVPKSIVYEITIPYYFFFFSFFF